VPVPITSPGDQAKEAKKKKKKKKKR